MIPFFYKRSRSAKTLYVIVVGCLIFQVTYAQKTKRVANIVFTSDVHFGLTKAKFRGDTGVTSQKVNAAMVTQMNNLLKTILPDDGGILAGNSVRNIDYLAITGDIANRMEDGVQTATTSWTQFKEVYMHLLKLTGNNGQPAQLLLVPGNHDVSDAIGIGKSMKPATDPASMVGIYNLMMKPKVRLTDQKYNFSKNKVNYSRNINGFHLIFVTIWPDSAERIWMEKDLATVAKNTPVIIFTHDPPIADPKHFTNPLPPYNMTEENKFENLLSERYKENITADGKNIGTDIEQRGFVKFLKAHSNIKAYFHGHSNYNEFYTYTGPDNDISLKVFRADSPMKGKYSAKDEKLLSFQLITLAAAGQMLTVRECLWNAHPEYPKQTIVFGQSVTISLMVNK